jgi:hypothetical protein
MSPLAVSQCSTSHDPRCISSNKCLARPTCFMRVSIWLINPPRQNSLSDTTMYERTALVDRSCNRLLFVEVDLETMPIQDLPTECVMLIVDLLGSSRRRGAGFMCAWKTRVRRLPVRKDMLSLSSTCRGLRSIIWPYLIRDLWTR